MILLYAKDSLRESVLLSIVALDGNMLLDQARFPL